MIRTTRARMSAFGAILILGALALSGCPGGGGDDASSVLMMEAFLRQPEIIKSFTKMSVAGAISSANLTPEQAKALAEVADHDGDDIRETIDELFAPMQLMAKKLDDVSRDLATGGGDGQTADEIMTNMMTGAEDDPEMAEFMELSNMMDSNNSDKIQEILAPFIEKISGVVDSLSAEQLASLSGVLPEVQNAFQYFYPDAGVQEIDMGDWNEINEPVEAEEAVEEPPMQQPEEEATEGDEGWEMTDEFTPGDEAEMAIAGRIDAVLRALGYEDPSEHADLAEKARPIIVEYIEASEESQFEIAEEIAQRLVDEVGPAPELLRSRAEMKLVSIVGCESAEELLSLAADR